MEEAAVNKLRAQSQQSGNSNLAQKCRFLSKIQILCEIYSFLKVDSFLFSFLKLASSSSKTIMLAGFDPPLLICGLRSYYFPLAKMLRIIENGLFSEFPGESASGTGSSQHLVASYILWSATPHSSFVTAWSLFLSLQSLL